MPFVSATLCAQPSSSLTARAVLALTDLTEKVLGKERSRTTVAVHYVAPDAWGYDGETQELRYARDRLAV